MLSKKVEFCLASLDELAVGIEVSVWIDFVATWIDPMMIAFRLKFSFARQTND